MDAYVTRDITVSDLALLPPVAGWATFRAFYSSQLSGCILFPDHQLMAFTSLRLYMTFYPLKKSLSIFEICKSIGKLTKQHDLPYLLNMGVSFL